MDTATSDIRAVDFTPSRDGDSPTLPDLLGQIPVDEDTGTVTADSAHDTPDRQTAEIHIRSAPMNRFNALGAAESARVA